MPYKCSYAKPMRRWVGGAIKRPKRPAYVRRASLPELKYRNDDLSAGGTTIDRTGTKLLLNGVLSGSGVEERNGNRITFKTLWMRLQIGTTPTTGTIQQARIVVVQDKQANGSTPTFGEIFDTSAGGGSNQVNAPRRNEQRARFNILFDKCVVLEPQSALGAVVQVSCYKRFNITTDFNATGDAAADINTNSVWLFTVGSNTAGATAASFQGSYNMGFIDN